MREIFPKDSRLTRVLGLLGILLKEGGMMDLRDFTRLSKMHLDELLPQITAAKMLGLIKVTEKGIGITPLGEGFYENKKSAERKISRKLTGFEPFDSALHLARSEHNFTIEELGLELAGKGILLNTDRLKSESILTSELLQWAVYFGLLSYNGREGLWERRSG